MVAPDHKAPQRIALTPADAEALRARLKKSDLPDSDIRVILALLAFNEWLQHRLSRAKLTIKRLNQFFGFKNESRKKKSSTDPHHRRSGDAPVTDASPSTSAAVDPTSGTPPAPQKSPAQRDPTQNHGRHAADDYTSCPIVHVPLDAAAWATRQCPACAECHTSATVYPVEPTVLIFLIASRSLREPVTT